MGRRRGLLGAYYGLQSLATMGWWGWMFLQPACRDLFFAPGTADVILGKFSVPDNVVFAGLGLWTGVALFVGSKWAVALGWATAGAGAYACFGALAINWPIGQRPLADALMFLTMAGSAVAAVLVTKLHG